RDDLVTGVQTCALPICLAGLRPEPGVREEPRELAAELPAVPHNPRSAHGLEERRRLTEVLRVRAHEHGLSPERGLEHVVAAEGRSEERRVGKEDGEGGA